MIRVRGSIASLLVGVGLLAVGFAALRVSSRLWASTLFSVALLSLVVAVAASIYRRGFRLRLFGRVCPVRRDVLAPVVWSGPPEWLAGCGLVSTPGPGPPWKNG